MAHNHNHNHSGSCSHDHDHDHDGPDRGAEFTLFKHIDKDNIRAYNEAVDGSAKSVFKSWDDRLNDSMVLESDADEQLILFIPFTGNVKLKSIAIRGVAEHAPSSMKVFINREDIDFSNVESIQEWDQEWELIDPTVNAMMGEIPEYPTRMARFGNVRNLTIFFPANVSGSDVTKIAYIGLKGEWTEVNKDPIITVYELAANPADHKKIGTGDENTLGKQISEAMGKKKSGHAANTAVSPISNEVDEVNVSQRSVKEIDAGLMAIGRKKKAAMHRLRTVLSERDAEREALRERDQESDEHSFDRDYHAATNDADSATAAPTGISITAIAGITSSVKHLINASSSLSQSQTSNSQSQTQSPSKTLKVLDRNAHMKSLYAVNKDANTPIKAITSTAANNSIEQQIATAIATITTLDRTEYLLLARKAALLDRAASFKRPPQLTDALEAFGFNVGAVSLLRKTHHAHHNNHAAISHEPHPCLESYLRVNMLRTNSSAPSLNVNALAALIRRSDVFQAREMVDEAYEFELDEDDEDGAQTDHVLNAWDRRDSAATLRAMDSSLDLHALTLDSLSLKNGNSSSPSGKDKAAATSSKGTQGSGGQVVVDERRMLADLELVKCAMAADSLHFYSFCKDRMENADMTWHCMDCGMCRDSQEWHCSNCNDCQHGLQTPCSKCDADAPDLSSSHKKKRS
ncbi:hypothetical protein HDU77_002618 [Chytriomyces hyalinus]|nr:hypothetical protein HDU77_002618 [Chytriomyces hyalinus]